MNGPTSTQRRSIHSTLVMVPLCLLSTSVVLDFFGMISGVRPLTEISYWMTAAGLTGGIAAAIVAWMDYLLMPMRSRAKGAALFHGTMNTLVMGLYAGSLFSRTTASGDPQIMATLFSTMGAGLALIGGWAGGEMVEWLRTEDDQDLEPVLSLQIGRLTNKGVK